MKDWAPRAEVGRGLAGSDLEAVLAILAAERDVQGRGHADIELFVDVEVGRPLGRRELAVGEVALRDDRRRRGGLQNREQLGVGRIDGRDGVGVAAVGGRQVPVPAADDALDAAGEGVVVLGDLLARVEAVGQWNHEHAAGSRALDLGWVAVVLERRNVAVAVAAEAVELDVGRQVIAGVIERVVDVVLRVAVDVVDVQARPARAPRRRRDRIVA